MFGYFSVTRFPQYSTTLCKPNLTCTSQFYTYTVPYLMFAVGCSHFLSSLVPAASIPKHRDTPEYYGNIFLLRVKKMEETGGIEESLGTAGT